MVTEEIIPNFSKKYKQVKKPVSPPQLRVPELKDLWDHHFQYVSRMEVTQKNNRPFFKPNLNLPKIREAFEKEPNLISQITIPVQRVTQKNGKEIFRTGETYIFSPRVPHQKIFTSFFSTPRALPLSYNKSKLLTLTNDGSRVTFVPTLVGIEKGDLFIVAYQNLRDKTKRVLIYRCEEIVAFPSDHPTITPEQGKEIAFVNALVLSVSVLSPKGQVCDQWVSTQNRPPKPEVLECLIGEALNRLTSPDIRIFRGLFGTTKDNLEYLKKENEEGLIEVPVSPDAFVLRVVNEAQRIFHEALFHKAYKLRKGTTLSFLVTHRLGTEGLAESRAIFETIQGDRLVVKTEYEPYPQCLPRLFNDIIYSPLFGRKTSEEFLDVFPHEFSLFISL